MNLRSIYYLRIGMLTFPCFKKVSVDGSFINSYIVAVKIIKQYKQRQVPYFIITSYQMAHSRQTSHAEMNSSVKPIRLPSDQQQRKQIVSDIEQYMNQLQTEGGFEDKIKTLILRKKLIESQGLSIERIDNLQAIFLHYCSHIFKTGKHMTFQRLQYEKTHLTIDRFFVFLKDFSLTIANIDGVSKQIIEKNDIVLLFKKMSINSKDLNFEQFISCLQKIGPLYYDSMLNYNQRQKALAEQRKKRKQNYIRNMKKRKAALQAAKKAREQHGQQNGDENQDKKTQQEEQNEERQQQKQQQQNDKIIESMLNDKNIENPNEEVQAEIQKITNQNQEGNNASEKINEENSAIIIKDHLLILTLQEKIEHFYQLINVDNATSFKKKMRELNLPLFQSKQPKALIQPSKKQVEQKDTAEQKRLTQLRNIIEQRKERDKGSVPYLSKEDYEKRKAKRQKEEVQSTVIIKRDHKKKRVDITDLELDLSSLSNMHSENINFHKFNPRKFIPADDEEDPYLEEYGSAKRTGRSQKRIVPSLDSNDGRSQIMLQKLKKRTQQIQVRQRNTQSKYSTDLQGLASVDHQVRKNRLVQKLIKIYKQ